MCLAVPGQVVEISDKQEHRVLIELEGVRRHVSSTLLTTDGPDALQKGEWVLVHVGFALARIDEQEALATLDLLRQIGEAFDDEIAQFSAGAAND